jgi:predicted TPR repeat methyltransferase
VSAAAFEARYRAEGDPWLTLSDPDERAKAAAVLTACGDGPFDAVCDLGCGLGLLAAGLAPRSRTLLALDAAPTAVTAAAERLAPWPHAQARVALLPADLPPRPFDLVVASEILYYLPPADLDATLRWLDGALVPGGRLVAVHWTGAADDLHQPADAVHDALADRAGLAVIAQARTPGYRLDVLRAERG